MNEDEIRIRFAEAALIGLLSGQGRFTEEDVIGADREEGYARAAWLVSDAMFKEGARRGVWGLRGPHVECTPERPCNWPGCPHSKL